MNNKSNKEDLLIIGNGFDLHCGLKSRFDQYLNAFWSDKNRDSNDAKDLFDYIRHVIDNDDLLSTSNNYSNNNNTWENFIMRAIQNNDDSSSYFNKNFWIIYLNFLNYLADKKKIGNVLGDYEWSDVENQLYRFLSQYSKDVKILLYKIRKIINSNGASDIFYNLGELSELRAKYNKNDIKGLNYNNKYITYISVLLLLKLGIMNIRYNRCTLKPFYNFLLRQLKYFESNFSYYLQLIMTNSYYDNSKNVLACINNDRRNKSNHDINFNIISFNYTNWDLFNYSNKSFIDKKEVRSDEKKLHINKIRHVHSKIRPHSKDHPIMGIDPMLKSKKHFAYSKPYYMFTKTYRIMALSDTSEYKYKILPPRHKIEDILFYGHSLAQEDYSYFESIFDYYHIYDSSVNLVFYYSYYGLNDNEDIHSADNVKKENHITRDQYKAIYKLINKYGQAISHRYNLLHKLLLESRLHIRRITSANEVSDDLD